jgi:hypothetical protein
MQVEHVKHVKHGGNEGLWVAKLPKAVEHSSSVEGQSFIFSSLLPVHFSLACSSCSGSSSQCQSASPAWVNVGYSSSVGKLDQAGIPASACTGLHRQKGKINPGDTGSQPKHLHIRGDA